MIPVAPQPEPDQFESLVRSPGSAYLVKIPAPTSAQWKNAAYWTRVAEDLRTSYRSICAYSAQWIPRREGVPSVDHYVPKSHASHLAYEWANYRLACQNCNARKRDYRDVLDPFTIAADSALAVDALIKRLRLNDENSTKSRLDWLLPYCQNVYPFDHVRQRAPFIAYELERPGLVDDIKQMMSM